MCVRAREGGVGESCVITLEMSTNSKISIGRANMHDFLSLNFNSKCYNCSAKLTYDMSSGKARAGNYRSEWL